MSDQAHKSPGMERAVEVALDEDGITIRGEATDCLATIEIGRDAGKAALAKES